MFLILFARGWIVIDRIKLGTDGLALGFLSSSAMPFMSSANRSPTKSSPKGDIDNKGPLPSDREDRRVELNLMGSLNYEPARVSYQANERSHNNYQHTADSL